MNINGKEVSETDELMRAMQDLAKAWPFVDLNAVDKISEAGGFRKAREETTERATLLTRVLAWVRHIFLFLLLTNAANAILIVNDISGDANTLHAEFTVDWVNGTTQTTNGTWAGGNWEFLSLNGPISTHHDEGITQFYLRNIWADGWNPGPAWKLIWVSTRVVFTPERPLPLSNINLDDPITFDYAHTGLNYHWDASLFGSFATNLTGGSAHLVFDLERTPVLANQEIFGRAIAVEAVPDLGTTVVLFGIATLAMCGFRSLKWIMSPWLNWMLQKCCIPSVQAKVR